jgi:hypothetical protein
MKLFNKLIDVLFPSCPSGLPHRIYFDSVVTNCNGRQYCQHKDCIKANIADCNTHICQFHDVPGGYNQIHERCNCGEQRVKNSNLSGWNSFPKEKPSDNQNVIFQVKTDGVMNGRVLGGWFCEQTGSFHTPGKAFNASIWRPMVEPPKF